VKIISAKISIIICLLMMAYSAYPATFTGANIPFDSSFHLGFLSGPGTGVNIGLDMFYPYAGLGYGVDIEQQVTNSDFEQNINILKYGLAVKYVVSRDLYLTAHMGISSFYLTKAVDYKDSFSGEEHSINEDTRGKATYLAFALNFSIGEYYLTPKIVLNRIDIEEGGTIAEFDLNLGHAF